MRMIFRFLLVTLASAGVLLLGGCATGLDKKATAVDWTKGSIVVMSVELTNQYKPNYQPTALGVVINKKIGKDPRERIPAFSRLPIGKNAFLVTQQILPGKYTVSKLYGMSQNFPILGSIDFSVDAPFDVAPESVIYLGRVVAVNKERINKDDQSAGGVIPLIDQAVSGFGGGTLNVSLTDNYAEDIDSLRKEFAFLQKLEVVRTPIQKMMLERTTGSSAALIEVKATATIPPVAAAAPAAPAAPVFPTAAEGR